MNILKSEVRYYNPFPNARARNEGEEADFANFDAKNCMVAIATYFSDRKETVRSIRLNLRANMVKKFGAYDVAK